MVLGPAVGILILSPSGATFMASLFLVAVAME
jgi:hypothetical protein